MARKTIRGLEAANAELERRLTDLEHRYVAMRSNTHKITTQAIKVADRYSRIEDENRIYVSALRRLTRGLSPEGTHTIATVALGEGSHMMSIRTDQERIMEEMADDARRSPNHKDMPNPTEADLERPLFNAIWNVIKTWDVRVPEFYEGYCGANGSHVKLILNAIEEIDL